MLFPTTDFAIFFAIAFTVNSAPQPVRGLVEAVDARPQLRLLRLGGLELLPPPTPDDVGDLRRRRLGQRHEHRAGTAHRHGGLGRRVAGDPRVVQVLRLRLGEPRQPHPRRGPGPGRASAAGGTAHRHLLLHLHGDQLRGRRLPARARAGQAARPRGVHLVLSPPPGRTDRAGRRAVAPDPPAPRPQLDRLLTGVLAHPRRAVQEGGDLLLRLERDRDACLHITYPALGAGGDLRRLGLRRADLLRLQRLHRHRHRPRHAARLPVPPELRRALHGTQPAGLLAALAHDAVPLAARLPLHPAGRERQRSGRRPSATS